MSDSPESSSLPSSDHSGKWDQAWKPKKNPKTNKTEKPTATQSSSAPVVQQQNVTGPGPSTPKLSTPKPQTTTTTTTTTSSGNKSTKKPAETTVTHAKRAVSFAESLIRGASPARPNAAQQQQRSAPRQPTVEDVAEEVPRGTGGYGGGGYADDHVYQRVEEVGDGVWEGVQGIEPVMMSGAADGGFGYGAEEEEADEGFGEGIGEEVVNEWQQVTGLQSGTGTQCAQEPPYGEYYELA